MLLSTLEVETGLNKAIKSRQKNLKQKKITAVIKIVKNQDRRLDQAK